MKTWILVADRVRARFFERTGRALELIEQVEHPEGRTEDRDLEAGRAKRTYDRHAHGRSAADRGDSPHERSAFLFARQLAEILERGRREQGVEAIVLVAEPRLLGVLRAELTPACADLVEASITKDLDAVPDRDIPSYLETLMASA